MQFFLSYLKQRRKAFLLLFLFCLIFLVSFLLYRLPIGAVLYPVSVCFLLFVIFLSWDCKKAYDKHSRLKEMQTLSAALMESFPAADGTEEEDYQQIICLLREEQRMLRSDMNARYADMTDYYTVWVHQIKTPITSMRLHLQKEDSPLSRRLSSDLFRIEQYVEMVLTFLRLDSDTTDYVIKEYDLDTIVKQSVKKFSGEFISRKLRLEYEPLHTSVVTDEKWLSFVLEQLLSNALKYTPEGFITIRMEAPKTLCICDTGIGIAPEDLPRIFEKGYTGYNGRDDKRASGIGLYLCRRILNNLGHSITAESEPGKGTTMRIALAQNTTPAE